ncbi:senescence-associated carboxylesterase 101 isoform X1 [Brassica napus]|uniref:senescence-associated carboxylesterase 101 isoform X1 n=1 Tax=Brassica napus TaxID=3708 RepID=UPI0004EE8DBB|nr:senescence-associated carboxylesterase 101 isoform X1 [Brassica napus]
MNSSILKSLEQGNLVLKSGVLDKALSKIQTHGNQVSGLEFKPYHEGIYTIVVFAAPSCRLDSAASTLMSGSEDQNPFHFLCSEKNPSFPLHTPAYQLFDSVRKDLIHLRSELIELLKSKEQVIITGAALGGSVASLFTLWLTEKVEPKFKRPLCITFGSAFIGDDKLQQILEDSWRNSCFLHVADAAQTPVNKYFKPFGTFLIWVGSQCVCIDDPMTVTELLGGPNTDVVDYGEVPGRLAQPVVVDSTLTIDDGVFSRMAERAENKKRRFDRLQKLIDMKINMIYFEWDKKKSKKLKMGFYDWYRTMESCPSQDKVDAQKRKTELNEYWKELVEEVKKMPQSEKALFKTRSLLAANNYRRMVEPLDIAEYYLSGKTDYQTTGRSPHYAVLEKLFKAENINPDRPKNSDLSDLLTFDSCFWAKVEEAMILTKTQVVSRELMTFEEDVWEMIRKREVSPEIFLEGSSFMKWWREYKEIRAVHSPPSYFTEFMINGEYKTYGQAC